MAGESGRYLSLFQIKLDNGSGDKVYLNQPKTCMNWRVPGLMKQLDYLSNGLSLKNDAYEKGDGRMCTLFEEIAKENEMIGIEKGKAEGIIETGLEFGLSEEDILIRIQKKLNISLQEAQDYMDRFAKQTV